MTGYTKLFSSITDSTIWREPDRTRLVWITMLAMADANGIVQASIPGLADRSRVPLEDCLKALDAFMSEDKWSRSKEYAGRRIAEVDGGWSLLNHAKYRAIQDAEHRKEQSRLAMRRLRAERAGVSAVNTGDGRLTQAEAEAEAKNIVPTALVVSVPESDTFRIPDCPFQELLAAYHEHCPSMSRVQVLTNMRMKHARARWVQFCTDEKCISKADALDWFRSYFKMAQASRFLSGRSTTAKRAWKADFEWLMNAGNFAKVVEGKYHEEQQ